MPSLGRKTAPLLRTVGGKRHASEQDHEELKAPSPKKKTSGISDLIKKRQEEDVNAEPLSSDNELEKPKVRPHRPPRPFKSVADADEDTELKRPTRPIGKKVGIRRPQVGSFAQGRADKERLEDEKENGSLPPTSSIASVNDYGFDLMVCSQGSNENSRGYGKKKTFTRNIHAPPRKAVSSSATAFTRATEKKQYGSKGRADPKVVDYESDDSDVSMKAITKKDVQDAELHVKEAHTKSNRKRDSKFRNTALADVELSPLLDSDSNSKDATTSVKPKRSALLLGRLGDWMENRGPVSSKADSGASQEALEDLNEYIQQLPNEDDEAARCTLCKEPVQLQDYWDFWKGKDQTVKNHEAFCFKHRKTSAQEEYQQSGYPEIDWGVLPQRIKRHRMALFQILQNDRQSSYRDRYEPLALTGQAAAVPSRRKDLPENVQEELESYALDDQSTYPGYYGPHGRRVITEHIMKVLKNEIKNCKDAVVQSSGPAAFVQAVLVPEAAVLLIMQDCEIDRDKAEEIREQTYEMGMLLHEEIEDEVDLQQESDDENDYHDMP